MSTAAFFADEAKGRAAQAVMAVEKQTSAEVVIAVRKVSGHYRAADFTMGFIATGVVVAYMLVAPQIFTLGHMALEGVAAFVAGTLLSVFVPPLRRLLLRSKRLDQAVQQAAKATFYDLGISRTSGRNGILVFVSTFERRCAVVGDCGIDPEALGADYQQACEAIAAAARAMDFEAFVAAVETLGPALSPAMPWQHDDVNELPDEVQ